MANIQAREQARNPIVSANADWGALGMDKLGNLFTANWPTRLALAGRVFSLDLGAADTWLAGNHDVDADQPEFIISVNEGWLLPISMSLGAYSVCDAAADMTKVVVVADRTQATTSVTGTTETALNVLDGGPSFGGL